MNRAAFIVGVRDVRIDNHDLVPVTSGSVAIDVAAVGICGSDLHYYKDGAIGPARVAEPFVPGHEFSGHLVEDCEALGLTRGTLVAVDPATPCLSCEWCEHGHHNLCPRVVFLGAPPYHGGLTQRLNVPQASVVALPPTINADQAAMLEPLGVCIHAVDLARARPDEPVTILGCGPIGLGILQVLRDVGVTTVHAVDPQAHRVELARQQGATSGSTSLDGLRDVAGARGSDLVIEATNSPDGFRHAVQAAAIGAHVVLVGIPDGDEYTLSAAEARRRGLTIRFSRRMGNVYPRAVELVSRERVNVDALWTHSCPLDGTPDAFAMQADEAPDFLKTIVHPGS